VGGVNCFECSNKAVARITVNGKTGYVCKDCKLAIVRRMEQVVARMGHVPNLREIALKALDNIQIEDLPERLST
jgi:hypothetical protein